MSDYTGDMLATPAMLAALSSAILPVPSAFLVPLDAGGGGDDTPPTIANITPAPGTPVEPDDAISFEVTDAQGLHSARVAFTLGDVTELAHDGDFYWPYKASVREDITDGWRFILRRTGGWRSPPTMHVRANDMACNEVP